MTRPTLTELADKYGTDKGTKHARGAFGPLNYTPFYESLFEGRRDEPLRVLEIGVAEGASLRMWREYFPNAIIYGIDVRPVEQVPGCFVLHGSQSDRKFLRDVGGIGFFDIVIDDGSHLFLDQLVSFEVLFKYMKSGGLYCVEDLQAPHNNGDGIRYFSNLDIPLMWVESRNRIVVLEKT